MSESCGTSYPFSRNVTLLEQRSGKHRSAGAFGANKEAGKRAHDKTVREIGAKVIQATLIDEHYYRLRKTLLRSLEAATQEMRDFSGSITGLMRAGVMPSICQGPLTSVLNRYLENHPGVELRVVEGYRSTVAEAALSGGLDFAAR